MVSKCLANRNQVVTKVQEVSVRNEDKCTRKLTELLQSLHILQDPEPLVEISHDISNREDVFVLARFDLSEHVIMLENLEELGEMRLRDQGLRERNPPYARRAASVNLEVSRSNSRRTADSPAISDLAVSPDRSSRNSREHLVVSSYRSHSKKHPVNDMLGFLAEGNSKFRKCFHEG